MEAGTRAVVYRRVSTTEQGSSGLGQEAQLAACTAYCEARGWIIASVQDDVCSGSAKRRAGLEAAIGDLRAGDVLIAAKADRLARSLSMFVRLVERAKSAGWAIVAADGSVDLTTPHGRAMAAMAAVFADLERELIGARTRDALAAARQRGTRLGRPANPVAAATIRRAKRMRAKGSTLAQIADALNAAGTLGPNGGRWYPASVSRILAG